MMRVDSGCSGMQDTPEICFNSFELADCFSSVRHRWLSYDLSLNAGLM